MAGSYNHCADEDGNYRGPELCENLGDSWEAIEEMFFMINWLSVPHSIWSFDRMAPHVKIKMASDAYFRCARGEEPWPDFMGNMTQDR